MPIYQGQTISFKQDILQAEQDLSADTLYMALYTAFASLNQDTQAYTAVGEVTGTGYIAGGNVITGLTINADTNSGTVFVNFNNVSWPNASFTARGALIYNNTRSNKSIAILDFGSDKIFSSTNNTVTMPVNSATTAILRFV
jgi:hypothetical protein